MKSLFYVGMDVHKDTVLTARMLKNNEGESIHIPTVDDQAARDLLRCREDLKSELHRTRQELQKKAFNQDCHIQELENRLDRIEAKIVPVAGTEPYRESVAIQANHRYERGFTA